MKKKFVTIISVYVLCCLQAFAQQSDRVFANPVFTADYMVGTFRHKEKGVASERITSQFFSLSAMLKTGLNENSFFVDYGKPHIGVSALGGVFSNRSVYGSVWTLYPTWQFEFFPEKQVGWNIKLGTGLAYFSQSFHKIENPTNLLIGSRITNITEFAVNAWIALSPQLQLQTGVTFHHFSNAHVRIPNEGLNQLAVRLGLIYQPGEITKFSTRARIINAPVWGNQLMFSFGKHELAHAHHPVDGPSYSIFKLGYFATKRLQRIHEVKIGATTALYNSYYTQMKFEKTEGVKFLRATQASAVIGHEFLMNRFGLVSDVGIILFDSFYREQMLQKTSFGDQWLKSYFSARLGLKCYVVGNSFAKQKIALGMFLNTHGTTADYLEFSASFSF